MTIHEKATGSLSPLQDNSAKTNYNSFDLAKFVCSILVVMIHVAPFGVQENTNIFSQLNFILQNGVCRVAVPLFFIFSGFFLYKKTPLGKFSFAPTKKYLIHILSLYLIWTAIYFPLALLRIIANHRGPLFGTVAYTRDFLLTGSQNHLWYLNGLIVAVILVSFLLYIKWSPKSIFLTSLACYIIGLLGDGYFGIILPLHSVPIVGDIIRVYFKVITTTRNGLFFGFFFVSIGLLFAHTKKTLSTKKSLILFLSSFFILCLETALLKKIGLAKDYNLLIFAVPTVVFAFFFLKSIDLKDGKIYKKLRELSSLIFYGHIWVKFVMNKGLLLIDKELTATPVFFISTLTVTILIALLVMKISNYKGFRWLKKMY